MQTNLLIDSIVRQTMVLIGQLSSSVGLRAPLAHIADEVFLNLSKELERQGVPQKVAADMFGIALRSYQRRVQRLRESGTVSGRTLWQAVLEYLEENRPPTKGAILLHFSRDDPEAVAATLSDLVKSGLLHREGSGASAKFTPASTETWSAQRKRKDRETAISVVWLDVSRHPHTSVADLAGRLELDIEFVEELVDELVTQGHGERSPEGTLTTRKMVIPVGSEAGWEAAVWDHYQAMVGALTNKLQRVPRPNDTQAEAARELVGGSTLSFELPVGHPDEDEVLGLLARFREETGKLFDRVNEVNEKHGGISEETRRVVFYFGQSVKGGAE